MAKKKDLLERIDEARANRVSPEKFEKTWGYSLDEHVANMMDFICKLEDETAPVEEEKLNQPAEERQQLAADLEEDSAEAAVEKKGSLGTTCMTGKLSSCFIVYVSESKVKSIGSKKKRICRTLLNENYEKLEKALTKLVEYAKKSIENELEVELQESLDTDIDAWQVSYRLRKGRGKRPSRQLKREELAERIEASGVDYARICIAMMDFDFTDREEEKEELLKRLNQAMPEGVHLQPCKVEEIELDVPIVEVECIPKLCKRTKPKRLH